MGITPHPSWRSKPAHEIIRLGHTGWYADEYQDELYIPTVWLLPRGRFLPGYVSAYGAVAIAKPAYSAEHAARIANKMAETDAEESREHNRKENVRDQLHEYRAEYRDLRAMLSESTGNARAFILSAMQQKRAQFKRALGELA